MTPVATARPLVTSAPSGRYLPNVVLAGAPRCGTSAMFRYLRDHYEVGVSSIKEVQYFTDFGSALFHQKANIATTGLEGYADFFPVRDQKTEHLRVVLEATPGYLYQKAALHVLPNLPSEPVFIFMLRRPSSQLYSSYQYSRHRAGNLPPDVSFEEFAFGSSRLAASSNEFHRNALSFVRYVDYLAPWLERCGRARINLVVFEAFTRDTDHEISILADWLGIDRTPFRLCSYQPVNAASSVRSRALQGIGRRIENSVVPNALRPLVRGLYRSLNTTTTSKMTKRDLDIMTRIDSSCVHSNEKLEEIFGLKLSSWKTPLHEEYCQFSGQAMSY